ncbi:hypothetical protein [Paenibacillus sp. N3.4]|uniref:hypothetical protein n=1 Tax=Paenibacillus sp. N3.4 TaxID=2603222 RepID=UPI0011CAD053|nr:hypothetical protein [Paenibacillus sp. N3.4]TXK85508.1 hypothetical protein FU659_02830 [Paenibacillus sp. N3.4]
MFQALITSKNTVCIRCGNDDIQGIISTYYAPFQLLKINNILIPIEMIEHIEVLEAADTAVTRRTLQRNYALHLVSKQH